MIAAWDLHVVSHMHIRESGLETEMIRNLYFLQLDSRFKEFRLLSIMSEHKKTITSISWHPKDPDIIASSGADLHVFIWSISKQRSIAVLSSGIKDMPVCIGWNYHDNTCLGIISGKGLLQVWHYMDKNPPAIVKDSTSFSSYVTVFRWHPKKQGVVVFGHTDGSISILVIGKCAHVICSRKLDYCLQ